MDVRTPEIKPNFFCFSRPPAAVFNCSFISDVCTSLKQNTETVLGLFQLHWRVEKYANEAEAVSVFYFSFISRCVTGLTVSHNAPRSQHPNKDVSSY